ncbi:MAG: Ig-like domain-containing protein, partial [Hyphomicrobiaceae bacterium]
AGNDVLLGGTGNDTLVHTVGEGVDTMNGNAGTDVIELRMTSADLTTAVRADLAALKAFLDGQIASAGSVAALATQASGATLTLSALGVTVSTFEAAKIVVDGVVVPLESLLNQAPTLEAVVEATVAEDGTLAGQVAASDADGDALSFSLSQGPEHGVLSLDASTGAYTYTPAANWSGTDTFRVSVADSFGHTAVQEVRLQVTGVADTPALSVAATTVTAQAEVLIGDASDNALTGGAGHNVIDGGRGNDVLRANGASKVTVPIDIQSLLADQDGSETLTVTIKGIPAGGHLSAGTDNGDGSWTLGAGDLAGLTLAASVAHGFKLTVTATSTEAGGASASATAEIDVAVAESSSEIVGGSGNDQIVGGNGSDVIYGGGKSTAPTSGVALKAHVASAADDDVVHAGDGNDKVFGNSGNDELHGEGGNDILSGGQGQDSLSGGDGDDRLNGNSGNDWLSDGSGNDTVDGSSGNDLILAGEGNDHYKGGSGFDTLDFSGAKGSMSIDLSAKTADGLGHDTFSGFEHIVGSAYADTFKGSSKADNLDGGAGDDLLRGMAGADTLTGGDGKDTFQWLAKDVVSGNKPLGVDVVTDFGAGDVLDLHDMLKKFKPADVANHVKLTDGKDGSMLWVDVGGHFTQVAMLEDVHHTTAADLLASGAILA